MNYSAQYDKLISTRKAMNRIKSRFDNMENHHIIPRSMGGGDDAENLVLLTLKEHFVAHLLLYEIYKNPQMNYALYMMMTTGSGDGSKYNYSSRQYEHSRKNYRFFKSLETQNKIWITDGEKNKRVDKEKLQSLLEAGWKKGRLEYTKETKEKMKGKIFINKNDKEKRIPKEDLLKWLEDEWKEGRKIPTHESIEKMKKTLTGKKLSDNHCENISKGKKGIKNSIEHNENIKKSWENREPMSIETKMKIGEKKRNVPLSEEHKKKLSKPVTVDGVNYNSIAEASKILKRSTCYIYGKIKKEC